MLVLADHLNPKFEQVEIQVPYENKKVTEMRKYDAVKHVLEDSALRRHLIRYPERHYIRKPGTSENMRVWSDVHTADNWWELQVIQPIASTGGKGQYTQWVYCELIVGPETICPAHTQRVNSGHIQKVPTHLPSPNPAGK